MGEIVVIPSAARNLQFAFAVLNGKRIL